MRMTAYKLIPIPVGEVPKPSINPAAVVVIEGSQSKFNRLCDDDFFHGSLPVSDGDRSQNIIIVHFLGAQKGVSRSGSSTLS